MQNSASLSAALKTKSSTIPRSKKTNKPTLTLLPKVKISGRKTVKPAPIVQSTDKQSLILSLIQRPTGASMPELIKATGWQAHSIRALISGSLRKKLELSVLRFKSDVGENCYRIGASVIAIDTASQ